MVVLPRLTPGHLLLGFSLQLLEKSIFDFASEELMRFKRMWTDGLFDREHELEKNDSIRREFLDIILHFVENLDPEMALYLNARRQSAILQSQLKRNLQRKCQRVFEGIDKRGSSSVLNQIYTDLYISEGETAPVNSEHEVREIEAGSRKQIMTQVTIKPEDILKPIPGRNSIRTVLTQGVAGMGKTVLTQKFASDWAEGKDNQDIDFLFPFSFRELNLVKKKRFSILELLHYFFHETKGVETSSFERSQVVIILDGLDECQLPLDFHCEMVNDIHEITTVDVLLTNLIRGNVLPFARLWITTRPAAASQIPPEHVDLVTEISGFTDSQKEEYFRKKFRDHEHAQDIISHIKTSRSLFIMCHIPIFCWITATVLGDLLKTIKHHDLPKTITEMYVHFLVVQSKLKSIKYNQPSDAYSLWDPHSKKMIESLGKLAFEQLQRGNYIFYESDLTESGLDVRQASVYSGVFTQAFTEQRGLYLEKVFCFIHLSVQEFLAALHVHMTFISSGVNLLVQGEPCCKAETFDEKTNLKRFYQSAVKEALKSPNGHLDLFLRFLLGLSLQSNQRLLQGLLRETTSGSWNSQRAAKVIKKNSRETFSSERLINLFYCLNELNDRSVVEGIQQELRSGQLVTDHLSPCQWSALAFSLLSSEDDLAVFDLSKYSSSEEALPRMLPVINVSKTALIRNFTFSERSIAVLSSVLSSRSSCLRELDLTNSNVRDTGTKLLSAGLTSPNCLLETLSLSGCQITEEGCVSLASALRSRYSHLKVLDLSYNHPGENGRRMLTAVLESPGSTLDTLRMDHGGAERLQPGLRKYFCNISMDLSTANRSLKLTNDNRKAHYAPQGQCYPDNSARFDSTPQLLCSMAASGRCLWEVEWNGDVVIAVTYGDIQRKGHNMESVFGMSNHSWSLNCSDCHGYSVCHDGSESWISLPTVSKRVAVYVDRPGGILSFYTVLSDSLSHLHTFNTTFAKPLYPGFGFRPDSSVLLCDFSDTQ
ncbi:protein NLRC3-like [Neosynchiropus ocellatus]